MNSDYIGQAGSQGQEEDEPGQAAETGLTPDTESGMEALLRDSDFAFRRLQRGETVEGTVVRVDQDEVLVDIGLKSEGVIPTRELYSEGEDLPTLHVGDRALVYVMHPEGQEGHAILSLRRARMERAWREIEDLYHRGEIIEGPVVDFNKGGVIVDIKGIRGFVPVSQVLDLRNVARQEGDDGEVSQTLAAMNGRSLPLKIIEINRSRNRLILSERAAVQERRTQRKDELMDQLQPGQVRRGVVSNLTSFGAFIDLGGADGLVHVSELSYNRVNHPSEVLSVGQEVDVAVLSVDQDTKKIALSLKRALPDPWTTVEERYRVGEVVPAVITKLAKFGAFAKVQDGLEGLIHLSELTDQPVQNASQVVSEGQEVDVKIIHINSQRRRLGLSVRQAAQSDIGFQSFGGTDDEYTLPPDAFGPPEETPDLEEDEVIPAVDNGVAAQEVIVNSAEIATPTEDPAAEEEHEATFAPPDSVSAETGKFADVQEDPATESEPQDQEIVGNGSVVSGPADASPPAAEELVTNTEEEEPQVASAASPVPSTE